MKNLQEKFGLAQVRQFIENFGCKFNFKNNYLYKDNPWAGVLAATSSVVKIIYYTILQATPV